MAEVKICGITRLGDAEHAAGAGAWALGMIFYRGSARRCPPAEADRIVAALRRRVELTGVFVNAPLAEIEGMVGRLGLDVVQLHGDEGPSFCEEVRRRTGARVMKAMRVRTRADVQALRAFRAVDLHLLDGAGGAPFDWELAAERRSDVPLVVAGGLTPDNVADAIAATHPFAVDTASGTEAEPGVKDHRLVEAFIRAAAGAREAAR